MVATITNDGLTFEVRDEGPPDGEPMVLLHGYPQDSSSWDLVAPRLHAAGFRTIALDQRGYSLGARPAEVEAYAIRHLVGDVVALLDEYGIERAHVVGHDWGAGIAWAAAIEHPDRLRTLTALATPHPTAMAWAWRHSTQGLRSWYMLAFQLPVVPEVLSRVDFVRMLVRTGLPEAAARRYAARFRTWRDLTGPINWYRALLGSLRAPAATRTPSGDRLDVVTVPTTYVWGRDDFALGRAGAERTARYVTGDYRFIALSAGHWLPETNPAEVAAAIIERAQGQH